MNLSIGENIKTMRRKCGFTQEELATRLSVTPQAVSKWENGGGLPDITQLVPLAQIFGITTDSLLGVVFAAYGKAHTEAALGHEKLLMSSSLPPAEKHLAIYSYFRSESEKEPTNYTIMRKCINHAAEISRYADFEGFMSDRAEERDEIFEDCERKNACIARYCDNRGTVECSDFAMSWIYIHTKQFDKAKKMIDRLPSMESNNLRESIMMQFIQFQYGFAKERDYIDENIHKLLNVTAKEFFYGFEDYAWFADCKEAVEFGRKILDVLEAYKAFEHIRSDTLICENSIRRFLPKCYAANGEYKKAARELLVMAQNCTAAFASGKKFKDAEEAKTNAYSEVGTALSLMNEEQRELVKNCAAYREAVELIERIGK